MTTFAKVYSLFPLITVSKMSVTGRITKYGSGLSVRPRVMWELQCTFLTSVDWHFFFLNIKL